jgi:catechol 2,3-dioxygenase-like lactoylglutathione lyase family enzyme
MKLNHLSLSVPDVGTTAAFIKKYFHFEEIENKGNNIIVVLKGKDDFTLVLTTAKTKEESYPADFHFGFFLDNQEEVWNVFQQLKLDGYIATEAPSKIRNTFGFYFHIPGSILTEISCTL